MALMRGLIDAKLAECWNGRALTCRGQAIGPVRGCDVISHVDGHRHEGGHLGRPQPVGLSGHVTRLPGIGQVFDDYQGVAIDEILHRGQPFGAARVHEDLVPLVEEGLRRGPA